MADIAMLVAEEYERRVKKSRKNGSESEEIDLFSSVAVLARRIIRKNFGEEEKLLLNWVMEPKSQIALAAINGFFSA